MAYNERIKLFENIEELRNGRKLITLCNFDRISKPGIPGLGLNTQFASDFKECLYRILKDSETEGNGIDLFLYTRGGDTNSVWPIVSLIREFDHNFEVLLPYRAHSAGTLLALASKKIVMTRIAELSPIDATTGNQFNPIDPLNNRNRLGISVEDLNAYKEFIKESLNFKNKDSLKENDRKLLEGFLKALVSEIHPLAVGNVHRVHKLIQSLAEKLLKCNDDQKEYSDIVKRLTVEPYSHLHMINRHEAKEILGETIVFANDELEIALDNLLKEYEDSFKLRSPLFFSKLLENSLSKNFRFIGSVVESSKRSYLYETEGSIYQHSEIGPNIKIQIPPGQPMPLIPGLPRKYSVEIGTQQWIHNIKPKGVTT